MKTAWTFIWHFLVVLLVLAIVAAGFGLSQGADFYYGETEAAYKADGEGPHVFRQGDHWISQTVRGNSSDEFRIEEKRHPLAAPFLLEVSFPLDGSHEIKHLQGNFQSANEKYFNAAAILGRQQAELFGEDAFLGRWLTSKNTAELVNGILFVHGGLHPDLAQRAWSLDDLNRIVRAQYRLTWYPKPAAGEDFLINPKTGPSWYRGYFKDDLSQAQVENTLAKFDATAVVVGHTLHGRVKSLYDGKVLAIDVKHPWDYRSGLPPRSSEGLWLEGGKA